nr:unnamed protein product [Digitaria exilis]
MIATSTSAKKASAAAAEAVGAKAARACDGCLRRRARWYCAADDAFLCQGCDTSVHSANPLARRHERLRLRPTSPPLSASPPPPAKREPSAAPGDEVVPAWFRRKARTPRGGHAKSVSSRRLVVPESNGEGEVVEEEEEQLLYRVPIFDPTLVAEFSSPPPPPLEDAATAVASPCSVEDTAKPDAPAPSPPPVQSSFTDGGHGSFEPTDAELREFAADMEALLGRGLDDGNEEDSSFYMETLGLLDPVDDGDEAAALVKFQIDGGSETSGTLLACGGGGLELEMEMEPEASDEMLDIDFDYGSPHQHETTHGDEKSASSGTSAQFLQRSLSLTLNYEAIIQSWGSSPWTAGGERPLVKLDHSWPHDYTGSMWVVGGVVGHGGEELGTPRLGMTMDGGREARVSRYREKRRTRLFAKKIRYEVRKLNAEKRPRMKGRFVKRATITGASVVAVAGLA